MNVAETTSYHPAADQGAFEPFVIQPAYVEQNARELAGAILGTTRGDARTLLHTTLNKIQPDAYTWTAGVTGPDSQFDEQDGLQESILRRVMVVDELPPNWQFDNALRQECRARLEAALDTLATINFAMHQSVTMVLASVLFGRLKHFGGGSNSSAIGCVWLNPKPNWTDIDWLENIVHEYVHQSLFIDDMRHGLFKVDGAILATDEALVRSALLERPRPYDRAFHSCFVSFILMQLDLLISAPERVVYRIQPLRITVDQLVAKSRYLTPHGLAVLNSLRAALAVFLADQFSGGGLC